MGYVMNRDLKWFLREAAQHKLAGKDVRITLDDREIMVRGLLLTGNHTVWGACTPSTQHRMIVDVEDEDLHWSFPVSAWTMDSTRANHFDDRFSLVLKVQSGATDFVIEALSVVCMPKKGKVAKTLWEANQEIEKLKKTLSEKDVELAESKKALDDLRYEKLKVDGLISNLRGDLKRLLEP